MTQRRVFNALFSRMEPEHLDALHKDGWIGPGDQMRLHAYGTVLPMIRGEHDAFFVRDTVREVMQKLALTPSDIVIVSGAPDVVYYVVSALPNPAPLVLVPIGTMGSNRRFVLDRFRRVILEENHAHQPSRN